MRDVLDDMLGRLTIRDSWYAGVRGSRPWAFSSGALPFARLVVVTTGHAVLTSDATDEPMTLSEGDCVIVQAGVNLVLQDDLETAPVPCEGLPFDEHAQASLDGGGAVTQMHTGRFSLDIGAAELLMGSLPPVMRLSLDEQADSSIRTTLRLMALESSQDMGAGAVSGRLADILFIQVLRAWCESHSVTQLGWFTGLQDPRLGPALRAMHADLGHPWTVVELARLARMSRSSFAAHFSSVIGEAPLSYLTRWRVHRAKMLLLDSSSSVLDVALAVGYESDTALNRAFHRLGEDSPGAWRRQQDRLRVAV